MQALQIAGYYDHKAAEEQMDKISETFQKKAEARGAAAI